jgi:mannose-6-phosphate isomerase
MMGGIDYKKIAQAPVFFERNRVFRVYLGGKLFHDFFGDDAVDNNYPEEWIASNIKALNRDSSDIHDGISKVKGTEVYFDELLKSEKELMLGDSDSLGILVKILDSAIRLPIQAHPDKAFSRRYFSSEYGKTETWIVLATRENAHIYFGFKNKISKEEFIHAIKLTEQEKDAMEGLLNAVPVHKGDVFLIPAKTVHAIGYGCLILEIQEPTDFTIQPEAWCGDYHLNEFEKYLGLDPEVAINCFDYPIYGEQAIELGRKTPRIYYDNGSVCSESIIGSKDTDCFSVNCHRISDGCLTNMAAPAVYIVTEGKGILIKSGYVQDLKKGDYFFLPFSVKNQYRIETDSFLEIIECLPPQKQI